MKNIYLCKLNVKMISLSIRYSDFEGSGMINSCKSTVYERRLDKII